LHAAVFAALDELLELRAGCEKCNEI
jgi:hypothetical protein